MNNKPTPEEIVAKIRAFAPDGDGYELLNTQAAQLITDYVAQVTAEILQRAEANWQ